MGRRIPAPALLLLWGLSAGLLLPRPARAQDLMTLLADGPVVTIRQSPEGRFISATAVAYASASPEQVYRIAADLPRHHEMLPHLVRSDTTQVAPNVYDVRFEVEAPGLNPRYEMRFVLDPVGHEIRGKWIAGKLRGSKKFWRMLPFEVGTVIYYTTAARNFSSLARSFEGKQQVVTVGVNVTGALAAVEAVRIRAEALAQKEAP